MPGLRETHERELKLAVPPGFTLPALAGKHLGPQTFTSTYFDTADRALARAGITLRRRVQNRRGLWQLKLPGEGERLELEAPGGPGGPPEELGALLVGVLRGRTLEQVAVLRTEREGVRARENGRVVADVTLDRVAVLDGRRVRERFVELEVEALPGGADALPTLERVLLEAGALPGDGRSKAFRALGFVPLEPGGPPRWAPPLEHVRAMIALQAGELITHDPGTRLGADPEELHQCRVATRRLRAVLRAARPLLEPAWTESLRAELAWLGGALGPVRDLDVLLERLEAEIAELEPGERRAAAYFRRMLEAERASSRTAMLDAMASARYFDLLAGLEAAAVAPRVLEGADVALRDIAAREFRKLRKAVRALEPEPSDDALHAVRIRGKRTRYAAELATGVVGKPARRFVQDAKLLQDVIGEHQDAVVAEERIRALLRGVEDKWAHFAAGRLVERERERRRRTRADFPQAWRRLEKSGKRAWL